MSKRKYHKSNCDATVRAIVEDALGRKVILVGKHAFELFGILLLVLLFYIVITISQPRYAVTNILLYVIPTIIGIYFGVKVIKHE